MQIAVFGQLVLRLLERVLVRGDLFGQRPLALLGGGEFFGSLALPIGFLTRPFALGLALFIGIAMLKSHAKHGFFLARRPGDADRSRQPGHG